LFYCLIKRFFCEDLTETTENFYFCKKFIVMRKNIIAVMVVLLSLSGYVAHAQLVTGGTLSADYRDDGYYIELAPKIGYMYSIFESGVSPFVSYRESVNYLAYGVQVYTQADIYEGIILHAEFQAANVWVFSENSRQWVLALPVGVGYKEKIADKTWIYGMVLYDLLYKEGYSTQKNPIFRIGITQAL